MELQSFSDRLDSTGSTDFMATTPKKRVSGHGRRFLRDAFIHDQSVLRAELERARFSITHPTRKGEVSEKHVIDTLRRYLPQRYCVESAIIIDSAGRTSDAIDVVIFDRHFTPTLLDQKSFAYVPAEAVYAVFEVKQDLNGPMLAYASEKAASVRRMKRTSVGYMNGDVPMKPKPQIDIIAGIVALEATLTLQTAKGLAKALLPLAGDGILNCGLAVKGCSFDTFTAGTITISNQETALMHFLFRLLGRLQIVGSVPAVNWAEYAKVLTVRKS
ncbi:MAG: hypothetical protein IPM12_11345 [Flavobacteriales bacterium]|nr:hypothetical protein [Flavobacteriales bacterium]